MIDDDSRHGGGPTPEQPYETGWGSDHGPVTALVMGGVCTVSTADLDQLAVTLTSAGDLLDDARLDVLAAVTEVENAEPPRTEEEPAQGLRPGPSSGYPAASSGPTHPDSDVSSYPAVTSPGSGLFPFRACQLDAVDALKALADGPGSLAVVASALHDLATRVAQASEAYAGAESAALSRWMTSRSLTRSMTVLDHLNNAAFASVADRFREIINALTADGAYLDDAEADMLQIANLLEDENLAPWVIRDLMQLVAAVFWIQDAETGTESAAVQAYLAQTAARLDPVVTEHLPATVQVGSRTVATSSLTPMQRVTAYLASVGAASAVRRHGERTGVVVSARGGGSVTVPPGAEDPFGLATTVPVLVGAGAAGSAAAAGTRVTAPASTADVIRYSDGLKHTDTDRSTGVISVLRTDHADGTTSWLVAVPGTTDWGMGDSNPQDLLTNLEAVAGKPTDMETAVVTAMRTAGVQEGDAVALYGHSQGGAVAANIAADPAVGEQFNIRYVLTAGSPVAGADLPADVTSLHLENTADVVPALDGAPTQTSATHTAVLLNTTQTGIAGYPHGSEHYAQAVEHMTEPAVESFSAGLAGITGAGEDGAVTTEYIFDIERSTTESQWEQQAQAAPMDLSRLGYPVSPAGVVGPSGTAMVPGQPTTVVTGPSGIAGPSGTEAPTHGLGASSEVMSNGGGSASR